VGRNPTITPYFLPSVGTTYERAIALSLGISVLERVYGGFVSRVLGGLYLEEMVCRTLPWISMGWVLGM